MIIGTLLDELERTGKGTSLATLCIASGMGAATIIERVWSMTTGSQGENVMVICEHLLDLTRRALLEGDFDAFEQAFMLPHIHTTRDGTTFLETREDLQELHTRMTREFARLGVDDIHRVILSASFVGSDRIVVQTVSHLLSGGRRVNTPFPVMTELQRCGPQWRIASANYVVRSDNATIADALMPARFPSELQSTVPDETPRGASQTDHGKT
jgi:hypothetical protein